MKKVQNSPAFIIRTIEDGILHADYSGAEMTYELMSQLYDAFERSGNGQKVGVLNTYKNFVHPKDNVMKYIASDRPQNIMFASAFVVKTLTMQLVLELFMVFFNKMKVERQVFLSEAKALAWLRKMRDEERKNQRS